MNRIEKWGSTILILGSILGSYVAIRTDIAVLKANQASLEQRLQDTRQDMQGIENRLYERITANWGH